MLFDIQGAQPSFTLKTQILGEDGYLRTVLTKLHLKDAFSLFGFAACYVLSYPSAYAKVFPI